MKYHLNQSGWKNILLLNGILKWAIHRQDKHFFGIKIIIMLYLAHCDTETTCATLPPNKIGCCCLSVKMQSLSHVGTGVKLSLALSDMVRSR